MLGDQKGSIFSMVERHSKLTLQAQFAQKTDRIVLEPLTRKLNNILDVVPAFNANKENRSSCI